MSFFVILGSQSLFSHHGWTLSQITYIGPTAELARKHLMWGTWESLLSKATWKKTRHMLAFQGLLDHPLRKLEVSLSTHRMSLRGVQTPAAAHCHQHRIHPLILLLSLVMSSEQRYCGHWRSLCAIIPSTVAMICFLTVVLRRLSPVAQPSAHIWHALDLLHISMSSWWIWYEVQHVSRYHSMSVWIGYHKTSKLTSSSDTGTAIPTRWLYDTLGLSF